MDGRRFMSRKGPLGISCLFRGIRIHRIVMLRRCESQPESFSKKLLDKAHFLTLAHDTLYNVSFAASKNCFTFSLKYYGYVDITRSEDDANNIKFRKLNALLRVSCKLQEQERVSIEKRIIIMLYAIVISESDRIFILYESIDAHHKKSIIFIHFQARK